MKTLSVLIAIFYCTLSFSQGLLIKPAVVDFKNDRGQTSTQTLLIQNGLSQKMQFKVYLADWTRDSLGGHKYMAPNTNTFSCAAWIKLDHDFVELNPGESKNITVTMSVPDAAEAVSMMKWAMVFIETTEETNVAKAGKGLQAEISKAMRMGIHIYQTPPSAATKDLKMTSFEGVASNDKKYVITCQNTGMVQLQCKSFLELTNLSTGEKTKLDNPDFPMFPGQVRLVSYDLPGTLSKGKYQVVAAVDAGEDVALEAAQKTIEIK